MAQIKFNAGNRIISLLKQIIIRLDFESLTDLNDVIKKLKQQGFISDKLLGYRIIKSNRISLQMPPSVVEDIFIPVERYDVTDMHRFYDSTIQPIQDVTLDITESYVCLSVNTNDEYDSIEPYIQLISQVASLIKSEDSYVQFCRIGIRKIDGEDFGSFHEGFDVFKPSQFKLGHEFDHFIKTTHKAVLSDYFIADSIKFNVSNSIEKFQNGRCRICLDMDSYIDKECFQEKPALKNSEIEEILNILNTKLYSLFEECVILEHAIPCN